MGGDVGLPVTVPAAVQIARQYADTHFLLTGVPEQIEQALRQANPGDLSRFEIVPASEVVAMDDPVEVALRRKKTHPCGWASTWSRKKGGCTGFGR